MSAKCVNDQTKMRITFAIGQINKALEEKPANAAEVDALQKIQDKLQNFFLITADYKPFAMSPGNNPFLAQSLHNMLNRYKNKQLGNNFDNDIMVQYQTVSYWQKVVCENLFIEKLYIGFISSLNLSATYHFDIDDPLYIDKYDKSLKEKNKTFSLKLYQLIMDHLFENLRKEFAKYGILPIEQLDFSQDSEYLYLLFNTCTKLIDGKPINLRNTDNINIDPTSDDYKNKILITPQPGSSAIPDFIQDIDVNPYYKDGVDYDYSQLTKSSKPIYFESKETLINASRLFLFLYRKKTCTKYMKKGQKIDPDKYNKLNEEAPQEITFISDYLKTNSVNNQISKQTYNQLFADLNNRNYFKDGGSVSRKDALDNTLLSLNMIIPSDPPDNQTYRLCKISGMPPIIGSPEMLAAARKAKLTEIIGEDPNINDADKGIRQRSLDEAAARNEAAAKVGEKFQNISAEFVEGGGVPASTNQIENLFNGVVNDVKLFFGYAIVMVLVFVLCYILITASPAAFSFVASIFSFILRNGGNTLNILFTGLGLTMTSVFQTLGTIIISITSILSLVINILFSVLKDLGIAIYTMITVALYFMLTISLGTLGYITQQILNFGHLVFGTTEWILSSGFTFIYQQIVSFIQIISGIGTKAFVYIKDQIMNFIQVSSGSGISFVEIIGKLFLLFFTIVFTLITSIITLLLSSIAFILNFFLGTTTNIVQTLYNYSAEQIDTFVKVVYGSGTSFFRIIYELVLLVGRISFASFYTLVEVTLSIIAALMKLILGSSSNLMLMFMKALTLILSFLSNIGSGMYGILSDIFSFIGTALGKLQGMSLSYISNLFSSVFNKGSVPNPTE